MPSTFTWLDYSEHERRKMLDVIELFGEKTTRDELGLGGVRDAFADLLFPGTSTIQTAAKYFLLVPWVYLALERRRTSSSKVGQRARKDEIELARHLELSGATEGVIGRRAKEKLQRLPSSVYWQGLFQWGVRTFPGSQDEYHRSLDLFYERQKARHSSKHDHDGESPEEADPHNWHVGLPLPDDQFPVGASLSLSFIEADYLRERLLTSCPQSLMAYLIREHVPVGSAPFAWDLDVELPGNLARQVRHGRNFSEALHGAQLLYNLILAERRSWLEMIVLYKERLADWWTGVSHRIADLRAWNRQEFWGIVYRVNPRVSHKAKSFIETWIERVTTSEALTSIIDAAPIRQLVENREVQLKGSMARVKSDRARELWNGAAGAEQLDLRWGSAQRIATDILNGLEARTDA